jgi:hypothetical protein
VNILDASMAGLVLSSTAASVDRVVDFVLVSNEDIIVVCMGWWRAEWTANLLVMNGKLEEDAYGWVLKRADDVGVHLTKPENLIDTVAIDHGRLDHDINREGYLIALAMLLDMTEERHRPSLESWIDRIRARPVIDPVEFHREQTEKHRAIGMVILEDEAGKQADVLVIDEFGAAATAYRNPWLESIASQWMTMENRPSIPEFLNWIRSQNPHDGLSVGSVKSGSSEGSAEAIALRSLTPTV